MRIGALESPWGEPLRGLSAEVLSAQGTHPVEPFRLVYISYRLIAGAKVWYVGRPK